MRKNVNRILGLLIGVIVIVLVVAFLYYVVPGPQIRDAMATLSDVAKNQAAVPTRDPMVIALATSQVQQGQVLAGMATQLAQPTATLAPTATPLPTATQIPPTATLVLTATQALETTQSNGWALTWFAGADKDRGNGTTFRQDAVKWNWRTIAPELWPTFPNVPNPLVPEFRVVNGDQVPDGLEYVNAESNFCQQLAGEACHVPVAAEHYLYYSGDYNIPGVGSCSESGTGIGCMLVIVNVGKVTSDYTGVFGQCFRIHARYWNGNALDMAIWGLTSQGANAMMNMNSILNPQGIQNAGANCSVPQGCKGVHVQVLFTSGNEPLLGLTTVVTK